MRTRNARRFFALAVLAGLASLFTLSFSADNTPYIVEWFTQRSKNFVRTLDTLCAVVGDTTQGPSVYCFGARKVVWRLQANSGTCSTLTVEVSNNDTDWVSTSSKNLVDVVTDFAVGDSLNQGGAIIALISEGHAGEESVGLPWRYARMFTRQRTGYTMTTASAGPTVACRTRADSLRWKAYITWSAP